MGSRRLVICPTAQECGGCSQMGVPYERQLAEKQRMLEELFTPLCASQAAPCHPQASEGSLVPCHPERSAQREVEGSPIRPILGMETPVRYRNKIVSPFAPAPKGRKRSLQSMARTGRAGKAALRRSDILTGLYAAGTHRLVACADCLVEHPVGRRVVEAVRQIMARYGMAPYSEDSGAGFVRHVVVRVGAQSGEVLVTLVTNGREFTGSRNFCKELVRVVPEVTTIVQNVNTAATNAIFGSEEHTLYGPGFILDTLCGLSFRISSRSFYQTNAIQTEVLYNEAIKLVFAPCRPERSAQREVEGSPAPCRPERSAQREVEGSPYSEQEGPGDGSTTCRSAVQNPASQDSSCASLLHAFNGAALQQEEAGVQTVAPPSLGPSPVCHPERSAQREVEGSLAPDTAPFTIIDAYCGTGTIGLVAAAAAPGAQVIGVDSVESAIADARLNARHNGIENARFVAQDAADFMEGNAGLGEPVDVLFMDPPRAGASDRFLQALVKLAPGRIVYISCNPETQVRDLQVLIESGYALKAVQPVDMFPHTDHVETAVLLSRRAVITGLPPRG